MAASHPQGRADLGFEDRVAAGRLLAREGRGEAAIAHFQELVSREPDNPRAHYELACAYDREGREEEALLPYRQAFALGLSGEDLASAYVGLGSTLRNVGQPEEAVRILAEGRKRFPADGAIHVFLALARFSGGDGQAAMVELLDLLLANPAAANLRGYDRAIRLYTDELRVTSGT